MIYNDILFLDKMTLEILAQEKVWLNKLYYADAERLYFEKQTKVILYFSVFGYYIIPIYILYTPILILNC